MRSAEHRAQRASFARDVGIRVRTLRLAAGYRSVAAYARSLDLPASTLRRCEAGAG
jgi:hypothetical protein